MRVGDPLPSQCQPQGGRRDTSDDNERSHCLSTTGILTTCSVCECSVHHVYHTDIANMSTCPTCLI